MTVAPRPTDEAIAEWMMATLRLYGASIVTQYKVTGLFLEAINAEPYSPAADK